MKIQEPSTKFNKINQKIHGKNFYGFALSQKRKEKKKRTAWTVKINKEVNKNVGLKYFVRLQLVEINIQIAFALICN